MHSTSERYLPIRLFAQREIDEQRVEGGGDGETPKWVLSGIDLDKRARLLRDGLMDAVSWDNHNPALPYTFEVVLEEKSTAKSRRTAVVDMLSSNGSGLSNVVGMRGARCLILRLPTRDVVERVAERMDEPTRYDAPISCIEKIVRFRPQVDLSETGTYKIKLLAKGESLGADTRGFSGFLETEDIEHSWVSYSESLTVCKARMSADQLRTVVDGPLAEEIFSIKPMPRLSAVLDGVESFDVPEVREPESDGPFPVLGILDSGVKEVPHLAPWMDGKPLSPYSLSDMDRSHGTFVSGIAVYGDELEGRTWVGGLSPRIASACVIPNPRILACDEDELVGNIREAIGRMSDDVKVWNLSVSVNSPISTEDFSDFAMALDEIQDAYGVLICKSAGNCLGFSKGIGKEPLSAGADSVRALTVGSVAHAKSEWDDVEVGDTSPFSRRGPGPQHIIKPEVSHFGGNAGVCPDGSISQSGVKSFALDGGCATACGTSFSTPRVSALASNLAHSLEGNFDPLLVKALIVHSATFPRDTLIPCDEKVNEMGFGVPADIQRILVDEPYEATLVLRDTLRKGEVIDIIDFPMPESLTDDGYFRGQIVLTLVGAPILDNRQGGEYCQSDIEVRLGTYDSLRSRDTTQPTILNPIGRTGSANLLLRSPYSKKTLKREDEGFALRERTLIEYGGKYYPVKKYAIDLADLTPANMARVAEGRKWFMWMKGTYREAAERHALLTQTSLSQEFCVLVTIRDPLHEAPVYNDVAAFLNAHGFWHQTVPISNEVRSSLGGERR